MLVFIAAGALLGFVTYVLYLLLAEYPSNRLWGPEVKFSNTELAQILLVMICGAYPALVVWLIVRLGRDSLAIG